MMPVLEPAPGEMRLWPATRLQRAVRCRDRLQRARATLSDTLGMSPAIIAIERIEDRAWEREWLRDFHAMRFGERLWICPRHERVEQPGAVVVRLDPGLAFGTGTHPTTAMCLEWLDRRAVPGATWIDSAAARECWRSRRPSFERSNVHCFDIDPQALLATTENAQANDVASQVSCTTSAETLPLCRCCCWRTSSPGLCASWRRTSHASCGRAGNRPGRRAGAGRFRRDTGLRRMV